jgi:hypothetical protein
MTEEDRSLVPAEDNRMSFGQTHLRPQDIVMPRIKVVQQLSKEATDSKAEAGDFYNTLTGEVLEQPLKVLPLVSAMQRVFLTREGEKRRLADTMLVEAGHQPLSEGDGLKCRSFDMVHGRGEPGVLCELNCPLSQWRPGQEPPLCTETYNVVAMTEIGELVVLSFSKSSAKVGKRFFSAIRLAGVNRAPWSRIYVLNTTRVSNSKGTFHVPDFTIDPTPPDTGQLAQALEWARQVQGVAIDVTPDEDDEPVSATGGPVDEDGDAPF